MVKIRLRKVNSKILHPALQRSKTCTQESLLSKHNGHDGTDLLTPILSLGGTFVNKASDFFQDWLAEVTLGAKNGGSFFEMMGPSISNSPQLIFGLYT